MGTILQSYLEPRPTLLKIIALTRIQNLKATPLSGGIRLRSLAACTGDITRSNMSTQAQ